MAPPRSRNPLFNRTPNYQRPSTPGAVYDPNLQPPAGVDPNNPAWIASRQEAARMNAGNNPMNPPSTQRRPAAAAVPGAGYNPNLQPPAGVDPNNPAWIASRQEAARMNAGNNPMNSTGAGPNLNGLSNAPFGIAAPLAGMMPGFAGMASAGFLGATGRGMGGASEARLESDARGSAERLFMIENTPRITPSSQAGLVAGENPMSSANAALTNGYHPLPSITEGQRYAQGLPMDVAGQRNLDANQNPMFAGMQSRFGAGGALAPTGDYAQSGGVGWYDRLSAQEKYGYGPATPGVDGKISSDPKYATGMLPKDPDRPARGTPKDKEYLARKYDEQERRQKEYRDQHGGMNNRQVRQQEFKDRSEAFRFGKAVKAGLNPMSEKARAMFPGAVAKFKNGDNPMAANSPFKPDAPDTPENILARHDARKANYDNSPTLQAWGADPELDASGFAASAHENLTTGKLENISNDGLGQIFNHVKTFGKTDEGKAPFDGEDKLRGGDLLNELWSMPENTPPEKVREWAGKYQKEIADRVRKEQERRLKSVEGGYSSGNFRPPVGL